jgi:membrane associated rhomboid family serine protease
LKELKISTSENHIRVTVFYDLTAEDADTVSLVLASEGIGFQFIWISCDSIDIVIEEDDRERALHAVSLYMEENKPTERSELFIEKFNRTTSGLFVSILLLLVHFKISSPSYHQDIVDKFGASAELILKGDVFRCTTALFLHGDHMHLLGNMAGIAFFCTAVISIMGIGLGWLMILCSGITGNAINALFYQGQHISIGSSTAVFGSIGILAAYRCTRLLKEKGFHINMKALLPMGAGFALLGLLGSSEHSDVTAHLFGYLSGSLFGFLYSLIVKHQLPEWFQSLCLFITAMILVMSWYYPGIRTGH